MFKRIFGSGAGEKGGKKKDEQYSPFTGSPEASRNRAAGQSVDDDDVDDDDEDQSPGFGRRGVTSYFDQTHEEYDEEQEQDEDGENEDDLETPLLPIFSAAILDKLPLYNITHAIRLLIVQRCETTLSWDQLRSPQISQFLVKPIQNQIRSNHFNRATLCALIANCLQFHKEVQLQPGMVGISKTRALISELLAMRLVKEYTTRELIDALSYDFDPLQGMNPPASGRGTAGNSSQMLTDVQSRTAQARGARVSTIEIAIRAQAKRFLAHPLVVQHLEAIWAGSLVFHSEADNLHRQPHEAGRHGSGYGTMANHGPSALPADSVLSRKATLTRTITGPADKPLSRRSVTLYDPRDASLFKLSRLRVPRYRQVFSTLSFAIMLGLFISVLVDRSLYITPLEVVFWFWSAGYMLDEVVGFTEQGFGLYILSFWNAFDLGILLLFVAYYCLRLYGIVLADQGKHRIASMAYDVLASTAVLLFPRLFSVLDHYRYFSQLLIAFRMMAQDLIAILVLILISCSGFFVAFTLSFSDEHTDGNAVAYALFQILMGFTPAAWEKWPAYNILGKTIMGIFLIICHFLIVTILITVLTNSFMAIVQNANEEHQFLFAVNTISMVKSDALFSYVAPTNIIGWLLSPLRYFMPFRQYVKTNRTIIKVSHLPILAIIFSYERLVLSRLAYEPIDLVEKTGTQVQAQPLAFSLNKAPEVFSPGRRLREPSVISFHKDAALEEVFRRPFQGSTVRTTTREMDPERRNSTNVVDKWMQVAENEGGASPPMEQPRSVLERLENRRPTFRRAATSVRSKRTRDFTGTSRSVVSDPDLVSTAPSRPARIDEESDDIDATTTETLPHETDVDGDDEHVDESDGQTPVLGESAISVREKENRTPADDTEEEFFQTPTAGKSPLMQLSSAARARLLDSPDIIQASGSPYQARPHNQRRGTHDRHASSNTIVQVPIADDSSATRPVRISRPTTGTRHTNSGGTATPTGAQKHPGSRTPKLKPEPAPTRARPIMPPRQKTAPTNIGGGGVSFLDLSRRNQRQPSFNARALDLASEIGDNKWGPAGGMDAGGISGMPASFSDQLLRARELERRREEERRKSEEEEKGMVSRIMLARMNTLEEGFREVLKEIKDLSKNGGSSRRESEAEFVSGPKSRRDRPVAETTNSSQSQGGSAARPKTPTGRLGGNEGKPRKSPRKIQRRGTKGKEPERPGSALRLKMEEMAENGDEPAKGGEEDGEGDVEAVGRERPGTAIHSPAQREAQESEVGKEDRRPRSS